jgi:hypothetical protein
MKKFYSLIIMGLLGTTLINAQPKDSVKNGGFEKDVIGATTAAGWYLPTDYPTNMTTTIVGEEPHSGKNALKVVIKNRESIANVQGWTLQVVNQDILVERNTPYRISLWSRGETLDEDFNFTAGNNAFAEIGRISDVKPGWDWGRSVFVALSGKNDTIRIPLHILANGTYYFDDLSVVKSPMKTAATNLDGNRITVNFEWGVKSAKLPANSFSVKVNGIAATVDSFSLKSSTAIDVILNKSVRPDDKVLVSYDSVPGDLIFTSGPNNAVGSFTDEVVDNLADGANSISIVEKTFSIYPNPVENQINVKGINGTFKYSISNYVGQMIMSGTSSSSINTAGLASGLYFINISTNGKTSSAKFLKK